MTGETNKGFALITGASSGIGATYAGRMAWRGYDLILVAGDQRRLDEQAAKLRRETGVEVEILPADLTVKADLVHLEQRLRSDAQITMLINNAGIFMSGDLASADRDRLENMIQLNVLAPSRLALAAIPRFVVRGSGTSSTSARSWRWRRRCSTAATAAPRPTCSI